MARTVKVDMTGVENYSKASEGIHTAKVSEILEKTTQGGDPMLQFSFEVTKGESRGCKVFEAFTLTDKALWKFKAFLNAVGIKAEGKIKIDLDKLIGKVCDIEVFWDEYNGQTRAKIADYYKAGKGNDPDGDTAYNTDDDEDEDEDDEDETPVKKPAKDKTKKAPEPVDDDEDEDNEDEDDEPEEKPAPKKRGRKPKAAKEEKPAKKAKKEPEPDPDDDDDDDEWEEDD